MLHIDHEIQLKTGDINTNSFSNGRLWTDPIFDSGNFRFQMTISSAWGCIYLSIRVTYPI